MHPLLSSRPACPSKLGERSGESSERRDLRSAILLFGNWKFALHLEIVWKLELGNLRFYCLDLGNWNLFVIWNL